ncbi:MAG: hypothetical protein JWN04_2012 [Myxococcaceae bacterium]|nr:hypothetical protein [Myxococcaceae bacterium]
MAAKKKKTTTKPYGNKTKFVLGLSRDLSAKEVVSEAKKNGITITEAHVYKIRSTAKAKGGKGPGRAVKSTAGKSAATKSAATKAARGGKKTAAKRGRPPAAASGRAAKAGKSGANQSKRDFVLSFGSDTAASEILRKAKEAGIGLSKAYLYTIRSAGGSAQKRGAGSKAGKTLKADAKAAFKSVRGAVSKLETQFIDAAMDLGLAKATELLGRLRPRKGR